MLITLCNCQNLRYYKHLKERKIINQWSFLFKYTSAVLTDFVRTALVLCSTIMIFHYFIITCRYKKLFILVENNIYSRRQNCFVLLSNYSWLPTAFIKREIQHIKVTYWIFITYSFNFFIHTQYPKYKILYKLMVWRFLLAKKGKKCVFSDKILNKSMIKLKNSIFLGAQLLNTQDFFFTLMVHIGNVEPALIF
ncbi:hypothetical protein BpHYR1_031069 [Brachionus plicatilis]|uniref:Uncharacterized protein n=1 Tax=Brachionus plicatilis TaxID=10195 RepID=A0A3M7RX80_BRAPC|nr:hypothetical protein BpHYR1_031069 [Brachionus plicatilis]